MSLSVSFYVTVYVTIIGYNGIKKRRNTSFHSQVGLSSARFRDPSCLPPDRTSLFLLMRRDRGFSDFIATELSTKRPLNNARTCLTAPFPTSISCRFPDYSPVKLQNLQDRLPENSFVSQALESIIVCPTKTACPKHHHALQF